MTGTAIDQRIREAERYVDNCSFPQYHMAYNLNNHLRSTLAAYLFSEQVAGAGERGPLNPSLPPWVAYLRHISRERGANRIHLADAFCGVCGVNPPKQVPQIQATHVELPPTIAELVEHRSMKRIGIVIGAGDGDRRVPLIAWRRLIEACIDHLPNSLCVLIGGSGEREAALALEDQLSSRSLSRLLNCVGRTTLPELAYVLNQCQWVVGSDTGPLHLGVACGARAIGWYFSRARVHETGPYGAGHYVWQYQGNSHLERMSSSDMKRQPQLPGSWPVLQTLQLIQDEYSGESQAEWELWNSHRDERGVFYTNGENTETLFAKREALWKELSAVTSNQQVFSNNNFSIAG